MRYHTALGSLREVQACFEVAEALGSEQPRAGGPRPRKPSRLPAFHIPKGNGQTRPLGIPTFEDKVLQRAVAMLLETVYEQDFLDRMGFDQGGVPTKPWASYATL